MNESVFSIRHGPKGFSILVIYYKKVPFLFCRHILRDREIQPAGRNINAGFVF